MKAETITLKDRKITLETGEIARQAHGAVIVRQLDTIVLAAVVAADEPAMGEDFFPLTVEYRERASAAGRIPSGFIKRENRPQDHEILTSRLIDRSIRPLFPKEFRCETQVMVTVLSYDEDASPEPLAILATSAALHISDIPWNGPVAGVSLVQRNGVFCLLPTIREQENCSMEMVISCSRNGLVMMEGMAREVPDREILNAVQFVQEAIKPFFTVLEEWQTSLHVQKRTCVHPELPAGLEEDVGQMVKEPLRQIIGRGLGKKERRQKIKELMDNVLMVLGERYPGNEALVNERLEDSIQQVVRAYMVAEQKRRDGRSFHEVRPISGRVRWLPRSHGSALFTRGDTQAIVTCTLGVTEDEQIIDSLSGEIRQRFYLHYNFPPYSVGEVRQVRGPGRREIGHGNLATRALQYTVPPHKKFPYTIRLVSDITESNGSSSMASVCGGCLAMMDAGVPIKKTVAGVAMGMLYEGGTTVILSDIMGDEDHLGDMDFKVAGTDTGVTAVQMDNKIGSLSPEIMEKALQQALESRIHILKEMEKILPEPRKELAPFAPRVVSFTIRKERIRDLIGPGGKNIQEIQEKHRVRIDVNQEGWVRIYSPNYESCQKALKEVNYFTKELEVGKVYRGTVSGVKNFWAFVRIYASTEGMIHVSELDHRRVPEVSDVLKEGDEVIVRVLGVDRQGRIRLSRKEALNVDAAGIEN